VIDKIFKSLHVRIKRRWELVENLWVKNTQRNVAPHFHNMRFVGRMASLVDAIK